MKRSFEMNMCEGPIFKKIIIFSIPLMLSGIMQLLFNAADIVVVGRFSGSESLAAVGSTSSLINLLINLFIGISVGANVVVGRYYGARDYDEIEESVHLYSNCRWYSHADYRSVCCQTDVKAYGYSCKCH